LLYIRNAEPRNWPGVRLRAFIPPRYSSVFCRLGRAGCQHHVRAPGSLGSIGFPPRRSLGSLGFQPPRSLAFPPWLQVSSSSSSNAVVRGHPLRDVRAPCKADRAPATTHCIPVSGPFLWVTQCFARALTLSLSRGNLLYSRQWIAYLFRARQG